MKKRIALLTFIILGISSCSNDDEVLKINNVDTALKLKAEKNIIEPFEKLKVSVDLDLDIIYDTYDSISWNANGVFDDGIIYLSPQPLTDERDSYFTDYGLGEHTIKIFGYKEGVLLSEDSVKYTVVSPKGDFLNVIWGNLKNGNSKCSRYIGNYGPWKYIENDEVMQRRWINFTLYSATTYQGDKYATMYFIPTSSTIYGWKSSALTKSMVNVPDVNDFDWFNQDDYEKERKKFEYDFFYNYITELYGEPKFVYEGYSPSDTNLKGELANRVSPNVVSGESWHPVVIWDTATSHIILTRAEDHIGGDRRPSICRLYAVPRKYNL